jgi:hypothetical protein
VSQRVLPRSWKGWALLAVFVAATALTAWNVFYLVDASVHRPAILGEIVSDLILGAVALWALMRMDAMQRRIERLERAVDASRPGLRGLRDGS